MMIGSVGCQSTSLTCPLCPGRRYFILPEMRSQTSTVRSAEPHATRSMSFDQHGRDRFFSGLVTIPSNVRMHRSAGANGLMSHIFSVLSIELDSIYEPSGDRRSPLTVSWWPYRLNTGACFRRSQAVMVLSIPPENTIWPVSDTSTAVTGYLACSVEVECFSRVSQVYVTAKL